MHIHRVKNKKHEGHVSHSSISCRAFVERTLPHAGASRMKQMWTYNMKIAAVPAVAMSITAIVLLRVYGYQDVEKAWE